MTQTKGKSSSQGDTEGMSAHGALVGKTVESCSAVLRNVVLSIISADSGAKEDAQAALEGLYKSHTVSRALEACKQYGASLSARCVAMLSNTFAELVLSSSKFLAQVSFSYWILMLIRLLNILQLYFML